MTKMRESANPFLEDVRREKIIAEIRSWNGEHPPLGVRVQFLQSNIVIPTEKWVNAYLKGEKGYNKHFCQVLEAANQLGVEWFQLYGKTTLNSAQSVLLGAKSMQECYCNQAKDIPEEEISSLDNWLKRFIDSKRRDLFLDNRFNSLVGIGSIKSNEGEETKNIVISIAKEKIAADHKIKPKSIFLRSIHRTLREKHPDHLITTRQIDNILVDEGILPRTKKK